MRNNTFILSGATLYLPHHVIVEGEMVIRQGVIHAIGEKGLAKHFPKAKQWHFPSTYHVIPGLIDLHIHGAGGHDVMDATPAALAGISTLLPREGTTAFLATTMTAPQEKIEQALAAIQMYHSNPSPGARLLGVHLEGPFISPSKIGAQSASALLLPSFELVKKWQALGEKIIKLITFAPELPHSKEFIQFLKQEAIIPALGHTNATFDETVSAIEAGCHYVTHLFNAMRAIHQREPGPVVAALLSPEVYTELIVDGVHLHPAIVNLVFKLKDKNKIILVTDAMRATCLGAGQYELGGQMVDVKNNVARLADGTLAGSVLTLSKAVQNMQQFTGCDLATAVKMGSENPAKLLNIFQQKGSLEEKKDADVVVLDEKLNVVLTLCEGQIAFYNSK